MKYCNKCRVNVAGERFKCPLCQNELEILNNDGNIEKFPEIKIKKRKSDFVWKFFIFLSIVARIFLFLLWINNIKYVFDKEKVICKVRYRGEEFRFTKGEDGKLPVELQNLMETVCKDYAYLLMK